MTIEVSEIEKSRVGPNPTNGVIAFSLFREYDFISGGVNLVFQELGDDF